MTDYISYHRLQAGNKILSSHPLSVHYRSKCIFLHPNLLLFSMVEQERIFQMQISWAQLQEGFMMLSFASYRLWDFSNLDASAIHAFSDPTFFPCWWLCRDICTCMYTMCIQGRWFCEFICVASESKIKETQAGSANIIVPIVHLFLWGKAGKMPWNSLVLINIFWCNK